MKRKTSYEKINRLCKIRSNMSIHSIKKFQRNWMKWMINWSNSNRSRLPTYRRLIAYRTTKYFRNNKKKHWFATVWKRCKTRVYLLEGTMKNIRIKETSYKKKKLNCLLIQRKYKQRLNIWFKSIVTWPNHWNDGMIIAKANYNITI